MRAISYLLIALLVTATTHAQGPRDTSSRIVLFTTTVQLHDTNSAVDVTVRLELHRECAEACKTSYSATVANPRDFVPDEITIRFTRSPSELPLFFSAQKKQHVTKSDETADTTRTCMAAELVVPHYATTTPNVCLSE